MAGRYLWPPPVPPEAPGRVGAADRLLYRPLATATRQVYQAASGIAISAPSMRELVVAQGVEVARRQ